MNPALLFKQMTITFVSGAHRHVDTILRPVVLPSIPRHPEASFQQDNASPKTTRMSQDCLRAINTLPWPARSPDLSPIEHF
ncbi:transposable element Tc1 transposase [Trichonephila clavipes]|uniref:Transposable element Tc1 transposase n=1 Tax=Trichonephila clavipes TaxID=2585209 RepID=A0A8X6V9U4_TRICX|nr:transposable element Tc1 transposase [Trichonephila clavipes]